MFFFYNQNLNLKDIDNDCYYRNDIEKIKKIKVKINNETFSYYHLCKSYILFKNQYNIKLILSFDIKKYISFFDFFLNIYYIEEESLERCNQKNCISFLCDGDFHYNLKDSKLIYHIKKSSVIELINEFPSYIQDFKKCYQCNKIWNFETKLRIIEEEEKETYDFGKCDSCKMKEHIESKSLHIIGKCPICLDNIYQNNCVKTLCKHSFHKDCLSNWSKNNNKCPLCRGLIHNEYDDNSNDNESFILTI